MRRAAAVMVMASVVAACQGKPTPSGLRQEDRPSFGGDFALTDQDGRAFRLQDVRGRPVVMFFGYTSCPDMCPATMSRIAGALDRAGASDRDVVTLFVSVDPKRDTPSVLKEYVKSFSVRLVGLTGTDDQVARVAAAYHASYQVVPTGTTNYLVNHTSAIFLIDRQGRLRHVFKYDEKPEVLAAAMRTLVDEKS